MTRRSERELKNDIDNLRTSRSDIPTLTLCEVLSYETEPVDGADGIVRIVETGELRSRGSDDKISLDGIATDETADQDEP